MEYSPAYAPAFREGVAFNRTAFPKRGDIIWVIGSDREEDLKCHCAIVSHTIQEGLPPNWQIAFIPVDEHRIPRSIHDTPPLQIFFDWSEAKAEMMARLQEARARAVAEVEYISSKIAKLSSAS